MAEDEETDGLGETDPDFVPETLYNPGFVGDSVEREDLLKPTEGIQDLKKTARKTLADFMSSRASVNNTYHSDPLKAEESAGHSHNDAINPVSDENAYLPTTAAAQEAAAEAANFATLKLGSFFGADKLADVIKKPGDVGSPTARTGHTVNKIEHNADGKIPAGSDSEVLVSTVKTVLDEKNRFSPKGTPVEFETEQAALRPADQPLKGEYNKDETVVDLTDSQLSRATANTQTYKPDDTQNWVNGAPDYNSHTSDASLSTTADKKAYLPLNRTGIEEGDETNYDNWDPDEVTNFVNLSSGTPQKDGTTLGSFFGADKLKNIIKKPGMVDTGDLARDGNTVTHAIKGWEGAYLVDAIEQVLDETNRYSPKKGSSPYITYKPGDGAKDGEETAYSKGLYSVQTGQGVLGKFDPNAPNLTVVDLKEMAMQLMRASVGHHDDPGLAKMIFKPSRSQMGYGKINVHVLRMAGNDNVNKHVAWNEGKIASVLGEIKSVNKDALITRLKATLGANDLILVTADGATFGVGPEGPIDGLLSSEKNANSYGQMNSYAEPFGGPVPEGMMMIALYGLGAVAIFGGIMNWIISPSNGKPTGITKPENPRTLQLGRYGYSSDNEDLSGNDHGNIADMFFKLFGIYDTETDYGEAVIRGLMSFYGIAVKPADIDLDLVLKTAINLAMAPGYYAVVIKQVIRDMEQIGNAFADLGSGTGSGSPVHQLFAALDAFFSSTTVRFINTMAQLGDAVYKSNWAPGARAHLGADVILRSQEEEKPGVSPTLRHNSMSRFYDKGPKGESSPNWKGKNSLNTYHALLLPNILTDRTYDNGNLVALKSNKLDSPNAKDKSQVVKYSRPNWITKPSPGRIPQSLVTLVEASIGQEYMPFSIHDIRTNEIISMPAFISSVSDSFSADYSDSQGYGRTDPVKIYNKTTRSIDLTFKLAAMSPSDHEYMWYIINRLTAMLYPQRSAGRTRTFNKGLSNFVQPFSQVPTASPMVRIRLGDLISSNYHIQNFARLFGWGDRTKKGMLMPVNLKELQATKFAALETPSWRKLAIDKAQERKPAIKEGDVRLVGNGETIHVIDPKKPTKSLASKTHSIKKPFKVKLIKVSGGVIAGSNAPQWVCEVKKSDLKECYIGRSVWFGLGYKGSAAKKFLTKANKDTKVATVQIVIETKQLELTKQEQEDALKVAREDVAYLLAAKDIYKDVAKAGKAGLEMAEKEFFKPKNNALVRSFDSTRGKGLAGFITQMSLNYDGAPWETQAKKLGNRAPMYVEIQMSFSPIHDLPLGLDHNGQMIAPSHPVGIMHTDPHTGFPGEPGELSDFSTDKEVAALMMSADVEVSPPPDPSESSSSPTSPSPSAPGAGGMNPMTLMKALSAAKTVSSMF